MQVNEDAGFEHETQNHEQPLPGEPTEEASTGESQVSVKGRKQGKEV